MSMSVVTQRQSIPWGSSLTTLELLLDRIGAGCVEVVEADRKLRVFGCIELTVEQKIIVMEWQATHVNDVYADAVLACIMQSELGGTNLKGATKQTKSEDSRFRECLIETLQDTFGDNCVPKMFKGDLLPVMVSGKRAEINLETLVSKSYLSIPLKHLLNSNLNLLSGRQLRRGRRSAADAQHNGAKIASDTSLRPINIRVIPQNKSPFVRMFFLLID